MPSAVAMIKAADISTPLRPHQQRVVDRMKSPDQPGLVVAHGLGSGKTLTSIAAQEALGMPADVIVPSSLRENYAKEVARHTTGKSPERAIQSLQNVAYKGIGPQRRMMIVDEAHRARDPSSKTYQALSKNKAEKRMLLTASPFYNHPSDIAPLINLAAGKKILPAAQQDFDREFVTNQEVPVSLMGRLHGIKPGTVPMLNRRREAELRGDFAKWVDYHKSGDTDYPTVKRENIDVEMDKDQLKVYDTLMNKAPAWVAYKIKKGLPPSKQESQQLNSFLIGTRQASNSTLPFQTAGAGHDPKLTKAYENLKAVLDANPRAKALVYSNFIGAGINPYKKRLDDAHIPYGEFTGEMPKEKRDDLVRQYNANKIRALLVSSAGGEGLDLKGTRLIQVLDPHWNNEKIRQIEGRGIRYKSHADLPEDERNVTVQRYNAVRPRSGFMEKIHLRKPGGSVDQYLTQRSAEKDALLDQFRALLPKEEE